MYGASLRLYNDLLETYFDEYYNLSDAKRSKIDSAYGPANLILDEYVYIEWYIKKRIRWFTTPTRWWRRSNRKKMIKHLDYKQTINWNSNTINTNKNRKLIKQIKKQNQTNAVFFVSAQ